MNAAEVSRLISDQVAACGPLTDCDANPHRVDLSRCLTRPTPIKIIHRRVDRGKIRASIETVWLVLEERPIEKDGYKIVYNEEKGWFGLASQGNPDDSFPSLDGYYENFPAALGGM